MSWMRPEEEEEAAILGRDILRHNPLHMLLNSFRESGAPEAIEGEIDRMRRDGIAPLPKDPAELGRQIQRHPGSQAMGAVIGGIEGAAGAVKDFGSKINISDLRNRRNGGNMPPELGVHGAGLGLSDFFMSQEPELPEGWHAPMALPKQEPLFQAHAKAGPPAAPAWHPPMSPNAGMPKGWHPPMAPNQPIPQPGANRGLGAAKKPMPNTPRDPEKERRRAEAIKGLVTGQQKGPNQSVAPAIHPSQDPFGLTRTGPQGPRGPQGAPGMMSAADKPEHDVQAGLDPFPEIEDSDDIDLAMGDLDPEAEAAGATDLRSQLINKLLGKGGIDVPGSNPSPEDRRVLDYQRGASKQNNNLDFMKLLMRSANQAGTLAGKSTSSQPFDDYVSGIQGQNKQNSEFMTKLETEKKPGQSDADKVLLALLKMDQDKVLADERLKVTREGHGVQREGNESRNKLAEANLNAMMGRDATQAQLALQKLMAEGKWKEVEQALKQLDISGDQAARLKGLGIDAAQLEEQRRKNKAQEELEAERNKISAQKAAKEGDHLPLGMKDRVHTLSVKQANRTSMINKLKSSLAELKRLTNPKAKTEYARSLYKLLNSPENPDAVGKEEAERIGSNIESLFRWKDMLNGSNPVGQNFKAFEDTIQSQINAMEGNYKGDQAELDKINREYPAPAGVFNPEKAGGIAPKGNSFGNGPAVDARDLE